MLRFIKVFIVIYIILAASLLVIIGMNPLHYAYWEFISPIAAVSAVSALIWCWLTRR